MHTTLDPSKDASEYWDFSWYEMGVYDLPAVYDYIERYHPDQKIAYVGHSEGTTQMFVALAEMEESYFADKTSLFVALGPVSKIPST